MGVRGRAGTVILCLLQADFGEAGVGEGGLELGHRQVFFLRLKDGSHLSLSLSLSV